MAGDPVVTRKASIPYDGKLESGLIILGSCRYGGYRQVFFAWYNDEIKEWDMASSTDVGFTSIELANGSLNCSLNIGYGDTYICILHPDNFPANRS